MLMRRTLAAALTTSLLLLTACSSQLPLQNAQAPRPLQAASVNVLSTNGALNLIEEMAHASDPQAFDRIEAAFKLEIAKSTRPSLDKIISKGIEAIHHHPLPGDILDHPVVRLIQASLNRYVHIMSQNLVSRMMLIFAFGNLAPEQHEAQLQKLQRSLTSLPKMDAKELLELLNKGFFAEEVTPGSQLEARLQRLLEERMAARI